MKKNYKKVYSTLLFDKDGNQITPISTTIKEVERSGGKLFKDIWDKSARALPQPAKRG